MGISPDQIEAVVGAIACEIANEPRNYIQDLVLPRLYSEGVETPVSGKIYKPAAGAFLVRSTQADLHSPGAVVPTSRGADYASVDFKAATYARAALTPSFKALAAKGALTVDQIAMDVRQTTEELVGLREMRVLGLYGTASNWATSQDMAGASDKWSHADSDPVSVIDTACENVSKYGVDANVAIITKRAYRALRRNAKFLAKRSVTEDNTILSEVRLREILRSDYGITSLFVSAGVGNGALAEADVTPSYLSAMVSAGEFMWIGRLPLALDGSRADRLGGFAQKDGQLSGMSEGKSATFLVRPQDWQAEPFRDGKTLSDMTTISYVEAIGVLENRFGSVITSIL